MAPVNDNYYFHAHSDAAISVTINGVKIIDHFMSNPFKGFKDADWGSEVTSDKVVLNSGMLYEFEIKYLRTPAHEYKVIDKSFCILQWSSGKLP